MHMLFFCSGSSVTLSEIQTFQNLALPYRVVIFRGPSDPNFPDGGEY